MGAEAGERRTLHTTDLDDAVRAMRDTFGDGDLRLGGDAPVSFSLRSIHLTDLMSARWSVAGAEGGRRGDVEPEPMLLTGIVLSGRMGMWNRWEEVDTSRPFLYPEPVRGALEQPDVANLGVSRAVVVERARAITGIDGFEVRFTGTAPVDAAMDQVWRDTVAYAARTADAIADAPDAVLARAALVDLVSTLLLRTFPNSTLEAVNRRDVTGPRRSALRRALQYIDEHAGEPIGVVDIAEAARLSPRGLYAAFQRDLGTSPMAQLRDVRLTAVRDELRALDPTASTVESVALRWGFADAARFRERYRKRFGEPPGETLAR